MKNNLIAALFAGASVVSAAAVVHEARDVQEGFYRVSTNEAGQTTTEFTPLDKVVNVSLKPRFSLEKRNEGCGPGSVNINEADAADFCLIGGFPGNDNVYLNQNSWSYCIVGNVVAYICPYSNGYKSKTDITGTWAYVKSLCGPSRMGWADISNGAGDWVAGHALKTAPFCVPNFRAGD